MGKYRYKYEYTSPFGENWRVDKKWFGFLWLTHDRPYHIDVHDCGKIDDFINDLEKEDLTKIRNRKLKRLTKNII